MLDGQTGLFPCRLKLGEGHLASHARLQGRLRHCACKVVTSEAQRVDTNVRHEAHASKGQQVGAGARLSGYE